ncbi:hypothetical protein CJF32_00009794 [Rutstroemia sp. NJR-2017a WRK4]|nr:hypothetical protein CJF32_00009794 [Rutstroemia sp. NJR-2017a WRK4]
MEIISWKDPSQVLQAQQITIRLMITCIDGSWLDRWRAKTDITQRLGREIIGYAYLLIIRFRAGGRRGVKSNDCTIDVWCFPRSSAYANVCTARYGLYRLVWRGWMQLIVTKGGTPQSHLVVSLGSSNVGRGGHSGGMKQTVIK